MDAGDTLYVMRDVPQPPPLPQTTGLITAVEVSKPALLGTDDNRQPGQRVGDSRQPGLSFLCVCVCVCVCGGGSARTRAAALPGTMSITGPKRNPRLQQMYQPVASRYNQGPAYPHPTKGVVPWRNGAPSGVLRGHHALAALL